MTSNRDRRLVEAIRSGRAVGVAIAEDPGSIAAEIGGDPGTVVVDGTDLLAAVAAARVRIAELVVDRAREAGRPGSPASRVGEVQEDGDDVEGSPSVRAADAHLRRQLAAWKVLWWDRELAVPELDAWEVRVPVAAPITLVAVDGRGALDDVAVAAMTATVPAAVRVVVLRPG